MRPLVLWRLRMCLVSAVISRAPAIRSNLVLRYGFTFFGGGGGSTRPPHAPHTITPLGFATTLGRVSHAQGQSCVNLIATRAWTETGVPRGRAASAAATDTIDGVHRYRPPATDHEPETPARSSPAIVGSTTRATHAHAALGDAFAQTYVRSVQPHRTESTRPFGSFDASTPSPIPGSVEHRPVQHNDQPRRCNSSSVELE
jgi:hypothetical protein